VNRPVAEEELAARLQTSEPCSQAPKDGNTVFSMSNACLEVSDANYREKGWGLLGFLLPGSFSLAGTVGISWMMTHIPPVYYERGQLGIIQGILGFFLVVMLCLLGVGIWALTRDCFSYTRKPIRFNRLNQTVYVFRHNGPGGVLSIPWDSAFFYVERKPRAGLSRTAPRLLRCLVLDNRGQVVDTFSVGRRVVLTTDEDSAAGQQVMDLLYGNFEYYRRFMEGGPSSVPPVSEFLSTKTSFWNSLKMQFEDAPDIIHSRNPAFLLLLAVTALPSLIQATVHYLAQLTCREPVWPDGVERACSPSAKQAEGVAS
jgi:hypothetical protein